MNIAMISTPFISVPPKEYGGTELIVHELVEGLVARGHQVTLFAPQDSRTSAELRSLYPTACWPPHPLPDVNHTAWAMEQVRDGGFDLVHAHSAAALAISRFVRGTPLVYTIHHVRDEAYSSFYRHYPEVRYVAISRNQASCETDLPRLQVIHHGLNPSSYEWQEAAERYVCFVGRYSEIKGPHTAIDVAERAGVPIRMAGEIHDEDLDFARNALERRLDGAHVRNLGAVDRSGKVPLLKAARAMLMPITWNEPFGLVMIEAMLSGCPVVAYPRGSVPELVEEGVTGFVVNTEDEMVDVIRPGGRIEGFDRRRCRERAVERFSSARFVAEHEALYERAIDGREPIGTAA